MLGVNVAQRDADDECSSRWTRTMGDIMVLAVHLHAAFLRSIVSGVEPRPRGQPLSERELECLSLSARGQTNSDIALKLSLSERTVQFHFSNSLSKLGAANRHEAVAIAVSRGLITR